MRLVIREYLGMLKESGELDELLPELLLKMGYTPTSKAQKGVRQGGVDVAVVGKDENEKECLLLLVIKCGNITRSVWDNGENTVRPSLNEVRDVYLQTKVLPAHQKLPKKIILCTNGDLHQAVDPHWHGYVNKHTEEGMVEFEFWGGDKLAELVETHLLDEYALPEDSRSDFRKTLALIAEPEYDLTHYYQLLERILFYDSEDFSEDKDFKAFKQAINTCNLLLNIMFHWAESENNLRNVLLASERSMLWGWELVRRKGYCDKAKALKRYVHILATHQKILGAYFGKMRGHYYTRDALSVHAPEHIFISESVFEQIGIVALIGLNQVVAQHDEKVTNVILDGLINLLNNNPCSNSPCYDRHSIEINLALLFLVHAGREEDAKRWLYSLCGSLAFCFQRNRYFPIGNDSFDDAVELSVNYWKGPLVEKAQSISTVLAVLAQWCCVLGAQDSYDLLLACQKELPKTTVQLWFPDSETEKKVYYGPAHRDTGTSLVPMQLPDTMADFIAEIEELSNVDFIAEYSDFSASKNAFVVILLTASRHFHMPVFPSFWQSLIESSELTESSGKE